MIKYVSQYICEINVFKLKSAPKINDFNLMNDDDKY